MGNNNYGISQSRAGALPISLLLLAAGLRAYSVTNQALRGDEAFGVRFSALPWHEMLSSMLGGEPHPPLHFLFLKLWMRLAGDSELAIRWPSVLAGVVTVALAWPLARLFARRMSPAWTASLAMLLVAVSPLLVYYSQDGRMYPFFSALAPAATWYTWMMTRTNRHPWGYGLLAGLLWVVALYMHYFSLLPLAAVGLALVVAPESRPRWIRGAVMASGIGVAYLPWALAVGPALAADVRNWAPQFGLWRLLAAYSVGTQDTARAMQGLGLAGGGLLALLLALGAIELFRRDRARIAWSLSLGLGVPTLFLVLTSIRPAFAERFAISGVAGALVIAAVGMIALRRIRRWGTWLSGAAAVAMVTFGLVALQRQYFDPAYSKSPDWRGLMDYLAATAREQEVIVLNWPDPAFYYYYQGDASVETSPPGPLADVGVEATEAQLERLRDDYQHIRFFYGPNPAYDADGFVAQWLDACCEKLSDLQVLGMRVQEFDTPASSLAARVPYDAMFEDGIVLTGYRVVDSELRAGETLHLTLFWSARSSVTQSYTVFSHLLASDEVYVAGADNLPDEGRHPTDGWLIGETVVDPHRIQVPAGIAPGSYRIGVGLYLLETGVRLTGTHAAGDSVDRILLPETITILES